MENLSVKVKLLKNIFQAITKAKAKGVPDPEKKVLATIKVKIDWAKFKSKNKAK